MKRELVRVACILVVGCGSFELSRLYQNTTTHLGLFAAVLVFMLFAAGLWGWLR